MQAITMKDKKIVVTGATGFLGRHVIEALKARGYSSVKGLGSKDYDLTEQSEVRRMFAEQKPAIVIHLAAYVGGIGANKAFPADFCYRNLAINTSVIHEAWKSGVQKLLTVIGGCSYPAKAASPIKEEELWNGYPQPESAPYSLAKAISAEQAKAYRRQYGFNAIVLVPGNVYGPYDNFSLESAHVIPALIRKFHQAAVEGKKEVVCWGSGSPTRDFVYAGDVAKCMVKALEEYNGSDIVNISSSTETSIRKLAETIARLTGYKGKLVWDTSKPDGQMRKVFDNTRMKSLLGFECTTSLEEGLMKTVEWFEENCTKAGAVRL
jgi:GDP-L-fucose synthase